jgi:hypothetical protein
VTHILSGWTCHCGWTGTSEQTVFRNGFRACPECEENGIQYFEVLREGRLSVIPEPEIIHGIPVEWPEDHNP